MNLPLVRMVETVRHLKGRQILHRLMRGFPQQRMPVPPSIAARQFSRSWTSMLRKSPCLTGPDIADLCGRAHRIADAKCWNDIECGRLWLYHLHYFDDLNAAGGSERARWHEALIARWLAENPPGVGIGWEPYPVARRIVNWLKWRLSGGALSEAALRSVAVQAAYLTQRLELDVPGNHLIADLKALLFAGVILELPEARIWFATGRDMLAAELDAQILPDGGHFELSPMYQAAVLEDLLDLCQLARLSGVDLQLDLERRCRSMLEWLRGMTHPNGEIAFFNDAALDGCPSTVELENYASFVGVDASRSSAGRASRFFEASGYVRAVTDDFDVFIDVAAVGPDHLPGHAHADTLAFELSAFGTRCIVNSGTSLYDDGAERLRQRGTAAHNTVVVGGQNSSDVWGSFRVGKRARVRDRTASLDGKTTEVSAAHDGYRQFGVMHRRSWSLQPGRLVITDRLEGRGSRPIESLLHFHPGVEARLEGSECRLTCASGSIRIELDRNVRWHIEPSTYHPRFGASVPNLRLSGRLDAAFPALLTMTFLASPT